jgi:hypothetical protein
MPAPGVRARARRRARGHAGPHRRLTGHDLRSTAATSGPKAFPRRLHPILHCHAPHAHGPRETDLRRPANDVAAVPWPHACTSPSFPWSMSCHAETCLPWRAYLPSPRHAGLFNPHLSPLLARDTEPRRGHHYRRRRAPCSARALCRPSAPKASSRTQRAYTPACCLGRSTCSPDYGSRRPPHCHRRRAPLSARSPSQPTISAPPLGPREATRATR